MVGTATPRFKVLDHNLCKRCVAWHNETWNSEQNTLYCNVYYITLFYIQITSTGQFEMTLWTLQLQLWTSLFKRSSSKQQQKLLVLKQTVRTPLTIKPCEDFNPLRKKQIHCSAHLAYAFHVFSTGATARQNHNFARHTSTAYSASRCPLTFSLGYKLWKGGNY